MYNPRTKNRKLQSPFPFPSYVVKSYSAETPQNIKGLKINSQKIKKELHSEGKIQAARNGVASYKDSSQKSIAYAGSNVVSSNINSNICNKNNYQNKQAIDKMYSLIQSNSSATGSSSNAHYETQCTKSKTKYHPQLYPTQHISRSQFLSQQQEQQYPQLPEVQDVNNCNNNSKASSIDIRMAINKSKLYQQPQNHHHHTNHHNANYKMITKKQFQQKYNAVNVNTNVNSNNSPNKDNSNNDNNNNDDDNANDDIDMCCFGDNIDDIQEGLLISEKSSKGGSLIKRDQVNSLSLPYQNQNTRKNLYRTRQHKNKSQSPTKTLLVQSTFVIASFRYANVSLYAALGKRDDYFNVLKNKQVSSDSMYSTLKNSEIQEIFKKIVDAKGRDKGRVKFNYLTSEQLRSIKYKSGCKGVGGSNKKQKKQKVSNDDQEYSDEYADGEEKPENMDYATWKRRNGVGQNQKVFIIKGGYAELRRTLTAKGWYENDDVWSPYFDFKWTTKIVDIDYMSLRPHQSVNHYNNNQHLTSKYGLTRRLKTLYLHHHIDIDRFYPRCYDLADLVDFENFIENFKFGFAETVCKRFLVDRKRYEKRQLKVRIAYEILKRRTQSFRSLVNEIKKGKIHFIKPEEWSILTETAEFPDEHLQEKLKAIRKQQESQFPSSLQTLLQTNENEEQQQQLSENQIDQLSQQELRQKLTYNIMHKKIQNEFKKLEKSDPQFQMNGFRNVWIAKPNFLSRGRGIRCYNNLYDIMTYCCGGTGQFVIQKYIENPLLVGAKKFDIRQWVCIQDYNPPKIWFYDECYIRFCADEYSLDNISNRFQHLTNNSVQKYSKKNMLDKSMWTKAEFIEFVGQDKWPAIQEKIRNIVVWTIKSCEGFLTGRRGNCQLFGYDFMIDENLNPWLIQINMSPSMEYSTPITKKLVKMVLNDTGKLIASTSKKTNQIGGFKCIYRGNQDLKKFDHYKM